ncbi:tyrosine-type recombinase/integrase [Algibacter amylolyticus]|uniref:Tyrosine-type recombinase/integrase n=1 Tax=Algibacter amylolyticus TaxID=1608400 RepID=A0A5M7BAA6_9FLAO|nr:tyrosine-type recombinase/integrase [Algibacter amylolyticus]KAA5824205.1 tyrosine-type recombinase/integrase [Algibacter amylolyticus]MBB5269765.1 site-specific recombinase XerD [Algibacter amylolyticus]TSJ74682.1 tyrosine-type recombinase/integrase [Algibacter amylolyticus]
MTSITLEPLTHNSKSCVAIKFPYNFKTKEYIKTFNGVYWSKTHRTFYIYYDEVRLEDLKNHITKGGLALINTGKNETVPRYRKGAKIELAPLNEEKTLVYRHFLKFLKGKRFSDSTIASYGGFILEFLRFTGQKPVNDLNENDVRHYIEWAVSTLNYAISTHRQIVSSITHFAYFYPACSINTEKIYMPKKDKKLPVVLSIEEVLLLIQVTKNLKHRAIIAMLYGSGLRIGELIELKLSDFDFKRKQLYVKNGKGRKDRYTTIAESLFPLLKNYHNTYKPKVYFIENPKGGTYSAQSIRSFLKRSVELAGINKAVTPHSLRHSYATHMLEQGIDIRYIQELLGHSRPETTMIYTHVTRKDLQEIKSPLDNVVKKLSLQDNNDKKLTIS